jgi:hypothetical protein
MPLRPSRCGAGSRPLSRERVMCVRGNPPRSRAHILTDAGPERGEPDLEPVRSHAASADSPERLAASSRRARHLRSRRTVPENSPGTLARRAQHGVAHVDVTAVPRGASLVECLATSLPMASTYAARPSYFSAIARLSAWVRGLPAREGALATLRA